MQDKSKLTIDQLVEHSRTARRLEARFRMELDSGRRASGAIGSRSVMCAHQLFTAFDAFKFPGRLELRMIQLPYPCEDEYIGGFRVVPEYERKDPDEELLKPLQMKYLARILIKYDADIMRFRRMADQASRRFPPVQDKMMQYMLYENVHSEPDASRAILYTEYPYHDSLMRTVADLTTGELSEAEPSALVTTEPGWLARRRLVKEARAERASLYIIQHPSSAVKGPERVLYSAFQIRKLHDLGSPDAVRVWEKAIEPEHRESSGNEPGVRYARNKQPAKETGPVVEYSA